MELSSSDKERIQHQYDALAKKTLVGEAKSHRRTLAKRAAREVTFSDLSESELPTNQIFELFDSSNKGKDISPYKIEYSFSKDVLSECELEAYEELLNLDNQVALLSKNGKVAAIIGYILPQK